MAKEFNSKIISYLELGVAPYNEVMSLQEETRSLRLDGRLGDMVIFCSHPPVFTVGKQNCDEDWLSSSESIVEDGIEIVKCNRGGRITYHGPGQLVVYFIMKISDYCAGVREFVATIEDICMDMLWSFGVEAGRDEKYPGVWINDKKIIAIGLNISKGVSIHGIAINVSPDMTHYRHIVPCGIKEKGVTSFAQEMREKAPSVDDVKKAMIASIEKIFVSKVVRDAG